MNRPSAIARSARSRPPVKQCSTAGKAPFACLLLENASHVAIRLARMDDQRQAGRTSGGDVIAEPVLLRIARTMIVVVVEPGLSDRHHFGMARCARSTLRP